MTLTGIPITVLRDRAIPSMCDVPGVEGVDLGAALKREWPSDAHFTAYEPVAIPVEGEDRAVFARLLHEEKRDPNGTIRPSYYDAMAALGLPPVRMRALVGDIDGPDHVATPEWRAETETRLASAGIAWYSTRGGYRVLMPIDGAFEIDSPEAAADWKIVYLGWVEYMRQEHGLELDPRCQDWTRCYRLPNVLRDGALNRAAVNAPASPRFFDFAVTWREPTTPTPPTAKAAPAPGTLDESSRNVKAARTLAANAPASISGQGGDEALFKVASEMSAYLGEDSEAIARVLLETFNPRCLPPWPEDKIRREATRAAERQADPVMRLWRRRRDEAADRAAAAPPTPTPAAAEEPYVDPWDNPMRFDEPPPPVQYLCEGLRIASSSGKITVIAGQPGAAKGPTADHLAVCFALGERAFGKFPCERRRVMLIDCEGAALTRLRCVRLAQGLGVEPAVLQDELVLYDGNALGDLNDDYTFGRLRDKVAQLGIEVLIVDSYMSANMSSGVEPNSPLYAGLAKKLGSLGICVIVVAHANKASAKEDRQPTLADIAYTGAFSALAQTALVLHYPDAQDRNTVQIGCARAPESGFAPFLVRFAGDQGEPLRVAVLSESQAADVASQPRDAEVLKMRKELATAVRDADAIRDLLRESDPQNQGMPAAKIRRALGISANAWRLARDEVLKRGFAVEKTLPSDREVRMYLAVTAPPAPAQKYGGLPKPGDLTDSSLRARQREERKSAC